MVTMSQKVIDSGCTAFQSYIKRCQDQVETAMRACLNAQTGCAAALAEAMVYATFNGGKRIRPALVYATYETFGGQWSVVDAIAVAVEFVHSYSLVHDDLPAMDDDELRRGRPTCHIIFGEAMAILAGDALQSLAFEVLVTGLINVTDQRHSSGLELGIEQKLNVIKTLAAASGTSGMAAGQALDLSATGQSLKEADILLVHNLKTGCLIKASIEMGALAVEGIIDTDLAALVEFGRCIGLAFQIQDDILDEVGKTEQLGKPAGSDKGLRKATYPAIMGLDAAYDLVRVLLDQGLSALQDLSVPAPRLEEIACFLVERDH